MEAAIARLDLRAHGQLSFLFNLIRSQPRSKWSSLLSTYVVFPLANNTSDHVLYKMFLDDHWRDWLWPFFERGSVQSLLSRQEERSLFTISMNIFAMVHHYAFLNLAESFGQVVQDTFSELEQFAGWDDEAIMLARLMLYASANKISSSVQALRRDVNHPAWSNLFQYYGVVEHFIFFSPNANATASSKGKIEAGFHIDEEGVFLDLLLVEISMKILRDSLKVETLVDSSETDKRILSKQKLLQKQALEVSHYFLLLYSFFQAFEDGNATDEQRDEIIKITSSHHKGSKTLLKQCIDSLSEVLEQQKRNRQLAAAASVARRVYFKVNDTIQVRNEPAQTPKSPAKIAAPKTRREVVINAREANFEEVIPILNMNSDTYSPPIDPNHIKEPSPAIMKDIHCELQKAPVHKTVPLEKSSDNPTNDAVASFDHQFQKLVAAFEDYKRILRLEERACKEISSVDVVNSSTGVAQREHHTVELINGLEEHFRSRTSTLRAIGIQAMKKQEESAADSKLAAEGGCVIS